MKQLLIYILSYLIGTVSGAYLIGNKFLDTDVRKYGSGNAGTTNAMRVLGKKWGVITFIIDFLKGSLVTFIVKYVLKQDDLTAALSVLFVVLGHDFPFHMHFKGGKGVATTMGALAVFNFKLTFIAWAVWMIIALISKIASLASIGFFIALIILFSFFGIYSAAVKGVIVFTCLLGIYRHKENIKRLIAGNENKIGVGK